MNRRWTKGELALCHCDPAPLGTDPLTVLRGATEKAKAVVLGIPGSGVEHRCPTATFVAKGKPAKELAKMIGFSIKPEDAEAIDRLSGGTRKRSAWIRSVVLNALAKAELSKEH